VSLTQRRRRRSTSLGGLLLARDAIAVRAYEPRRVGTLFGAFPAPKDFVPVEHRSAIPCVCIYPVANWYFFWYLPMHWLYVLYLCVLDLLVL